MKPSSRSTLLALAGLTLLAPLALTMAQAPEAVQPQLPSAREIVDRFATVTHTRETLARTRSMHIKGSFEMESMGLKGAAVIWSAKPDLRHVSIDMGAFGLMVTGYDGKTAWMTHPMMGSRILTGTELLASRLEATYDAALKSSDQYESMRTVGREVFEGRDCYKLELVAKPLEGMDPASTLKVRTSHEFYEVETGYLAGTSGYQQGEMGEGPFTSVLLEYKDFGGQLVATRNQLRQAGVEILMSVESIEFDTATETTFALPVEIRKLLEAPAATPAPAK